MILENNEHLEVFKKIYSTEDCIVIPIQCNDTKHSVSDELSLLYVQMWGGNEFILPFNHNETLDIEIPNLKSTIIYRRYRY